MPSKPEQTTKTSIGLVHDFVRTKLLGNAPCFLAVLKIIRKVSGTDAAILINGETGTGKELTARAIHYSSEKRDGPFVPVNCGAIPDNLLESELFGHLEGSFTDAKQTRTGLVSAADGGTLFLDEIEALSPRGQVVLLRFLEDFEFRPVGQRGLKKVDVRIVAATNSDLLAMAHQDRFRLDLLYRLAVVSFELPPLRDRDDDKRLLAEHFARECAAQYQRTSWQLHDDLYEAIEAHDWPGNVRELRNFIHAAFLLSSGPMITLPSNGIMGTLGSGAKKTSTPLFDASLSLAKSRLVADFERRYVVRALTKAGGNISHAAKIAGKDRRSFGRLIKKYEIDVHNLKSLD